MFRDRGFERRSFSPVKVGDIIDATIEAVGEKGDGIAKIKGFVIFVPNAKEGETVKIKITKVLRKVGFGEIVGEGQAEAEEESYEEEEVEEDKEAEEKPKKGKPQKKKQEAEEEAEEESYEEEEVEEDKEAEGEISKESYEEEPKDEE